MCQQIIQTDWKVVSEQPTSGGGHYIAPGALHQVRCLSAHTRSRFSCNCLETLIENMVEECLVQDLLSSPAFCDLIHSLQPDALEHQDPPYAEDDDHHDSSQSIPPELVQLTVQTLLEECQQRTCTSSDTTLALKGLSDQSPVHLQIHRCVLTLRASWTHPSLLIWPCTFAGAS